MKLLVSLFFIVVISVIVYVISFHILQPNNKNKKNSKNWKPLLIAVIVGSCLMLFLASALYSSSHAPDTQCTTIHSVTSKPPPTQITALDYFLLGNYDYDRGDCNKAIIDYTKAIQLSPTYPEAYNNRAYTYMRLQEYTNALSDLNQALTLNPNYIQALMNRGDIYNNYIVNRQLAIIDYQKVISLGGTKATSVCGHLFLAKHNGWNIGTFLDLPRLLVSSCE